MIHPIHEIENGKERARALRLLQGKQQVTAPVTHKSDSFIRGLVSWSRTAALSGHLQNTQGTISHQKASHISPSEHGQFIFMSTSVKNSQNNCLVSLGSSTKDASLIPQRVEHSCVYSQNSHTIES